MSNAIGEFLVNIVAFCLCLVLSVIMAAGLQMAFSMSGLAALVHYTPTIALILGVTVVFSAFRTPQHLHESTSTLVGIRVARTITVWAFVGLIALVR